MYRILDTSVRAGSGTPAHALPGRVLRLATPAAGRQGPCQSVQAQESARLGIRCHGLPMPPATLRVLETTWRVWREPLA
jgi:hypothetical protein